MARIEEFDPTNSRPCCDAMRLDVGGCAAGAAPLHYREAEAEAQLHLDAAFVHDEVVDGAVARFKVGLEAETLCQQHANRVPLFQPDLVIGEPREPGVGRFVRAGLDGVERVRDPVRRADDRGIEAVSNLEQGLDGKVRGFETAGVRRAGDGYVESGIRRRRRADGGNVKGQRGRVAGFFHDGSLRVQV